jgi:hypothetical protein
LVTEFPRRDVMAFKVYWNSVEPRIIRIALAVKKWNRTKKKC